MQSATLKSGDYSAFKQLTSFENVHEMNIFVRRFLYTYKHELTPSSVEVIKEMTRFACKYPGVCWLKIKNIAKSIEKSPRTIKRALKQLEEFGILTRYRTVRRFGGDGHPVFVLNQIEGLKDLPNNVTPVVTPEMSPRGDGENPSYSKDKPLKNEPETMILKTSPSKRKNVQRKVSLKSKILDSTFVSVKIPAEFVERVKYGFDDVVIIEKLWRSAQAAFKNTAGLLNYCDVDLALSAFNETAKAYKRGVMKKSFGAYYYGTLTKMIEEQEQETEAEQRRKTNSGGIFGNWLFKEVTQ